MVGAALLKRPWPEGSTWLDREGEGDPPAFVKPPADGLTSMPESVACPRGGAGLRAEGILGQGSFGVVYRAVVADSGLAVAVKSLKVREGQPCIEAQVLMRIRGSPNLVTLLGSFLTGSGEGHRLNLVMELFPENLAQIIQRWHQCCHSNLDLSVVRLYFFQLLRGMASLERHCIVHRDIKPANLLVDSAAVCLKVCDFGTAKSSDPGLGDHQPYVCSRFYRAPELILSAPQYGTAVDLWSAGCVLGEMFRGSPMFGGADGVDQLAAIVEIMGFPQPDEVRDMNPKFPSTAKFPQVVEPLQLGEVLGSRAGPEIMDMIRGLLNYSPSRRPTALMCMTHMMFLPLWNCAPGAWKMPEHASVMDIKAEELSACKDKAVRGKLVSLVVRALGRLPSGL